MTPRTAAHQVPLSVGFSRQEYWSGLLCTPPGDLLNPGIEPRFSALQTDSLLSEPPEKPLSCAAAAAAAAKSLHGLNMNLAELYLFIYFYKMVQ